MANIRESISLLNERLIPDKLKIKDVDFWRTHTPQGVGASLDGTLYYDTPKGKIILCRVILDHNNGRDDIQLDGVNRGTLDEKELKGFLKDNRKEIEKLLKSAKEHMIKNYID